MESPAKTLPEALAKMSCRPEPRPMGIVGWPEGGPDQVPFADLGAQEGPFQVIREGGEWTVLVDWPTAQALSGAHPGANLAGPLTWIRFEMPMDWELVGFLARVAEALAQVGIPIGAVCGFSRDHVFVPTDRASEAFAALAGLGVQIPRGDQGSA